MKNIKIPNKQFENNQIEQEHKKSLNERFNVSECTNVQALTKFWKKHFQIRTSQFSFNGEKYPCNYMMLIYIKTS